MKKKIELTNVGFMSPSVIDARCPHCKKEVGFAGISKYQDVHGYNFEGEYRIGLRVCPRAECKGQLLFHFIDADLTTYPSQIIDFEKKEIPKKISDNFEEALKCESIGCYTASAIMVRKTLEMICEDRGAKGKYLINKIGNLKSQVILPIQLFDAMDNLRLLGNDAAHVELKDFGNIGKNELEIAIDLTKEILKSIYQLDDIVGKLKDLKKSDNVN